MDMFRASTHAPIRSVTQGPPAISPSIVGMHVMPHERLATMFLSLSMYIVFLPLFFFHVVGQVEASTTVRQVKRLVAGFMFDVKQPLDDCGSFLNQSIQELEAPKMLKANAAVAADNVAVKKRVWIIWGPAAAACFLLALGLWGVGRWHHRHRNPSKHFVQGRIHLPSHHTLRSILVTAMVMLCVTIAGEFLFMFTLPNNTDPLDTNTVRQDIVRAFQKRIAACEAGEV